ncbi:hypothetical protein ACFLYI_02250 [Chloroflexota bacterium]
METTSKRTWKPTTAGVLNIITGALSAFGIIAIIIVLAVFDTVILSDYLIPTQDIAFVMPIVNTILIGALILTILHAVFPIIGGMYALQRRKWGWALAGSIVAILATFPFGVASTILVIIAKDEFE